MGQDDAAVQQMAIAILDYDAGNLTSVQRALAHLGLEAAVTADPSVVARADQVVFPGVGAAGQCMGSLRARGLDRALQAAVAANKPVLVICVGMQLLFESSEEDGGVPCLGLLPGRVVRFRPRDPAIKVPHMGWNPTRLIDPVLSRGLPQDPCLYYVHSYHCVPGSGVEVIATADHGGTFCAGVRRGNLAAMQFHPEKSGAVGLQLIRNFLVG
jgi:imidazole glycerol-phosphate synthase subunit HisH